MTDELRKRIADTIAKGRVMLFMKGNPAMPQCGFSAAVVAVLKEAGVPVRVVQHPGRPGAARGPEGILELADLSPALRRRQAGRRRRHRARPARARRAQGAPGGVTFRCGSCVERRGRVGSVVGPRAWPCCDRRLHQRHALWRRPSGRGRPGRRRRCRRRRGRPGGATGGAAGGHGGAAGAVGGGAGAGGSAPEAAGGSAAGGAAGGAAGKGGSTAGSGGAAGKGGSAAGAGGSSAPRAARAERAPPWRSPMRPPPPPPRSTPSGSPTRARRRRSSARSRRATTSATTRPTR